MSQFTIILLIALIGLISLFIWNGINFRSLKKLSRAKDHELNDSKYWELKYKYEFLIAIIGIITATAGFLGYNSLQSIETAVRDDFDKKVDSIKNTLQLSYSEINSRLTIAKGEVGDIDTRVKNSQNQIDKGISALTTLRKQQDILRQSGVKSKKDLDDLYDHIQNIDKQNKIKREFYLVANKPFSGKLSVDNSLVKIKFVDLRTITGDKLPTFKKPPIVISTFTNNTRFEISSVSNEGFEGYFLVYGVPNDEKMAKETYFTSFIIYSVD